MTEKTLISTPDEDAASDQHVPSQLHRVVIPLQVDNHKCES
jgi:hypothetical protein